MELKNGKNKKLICKKNLKKRFKPQLLKKTFVNNMVIDGKKLKSERNFNRNLKEIQKTVMKSHELLFKIAILNSTPIFRIIELKKKSRKKKNQTKEVPAFLSYDSFRTSWAIKYLIGSKKKKTKNFYYNSLKNKILFNAQNLGLSIEFKKQTQKQALEKQALFRYYK